MREKGDLELGNRLADSVSELNLTTTTTELEQMWHFLALLLSLGRPVRPAKLASRCTLFCASPTSSSPSARSRRRQRPRASPSGLVPLPSPDSTNSRNSRRRKLGPALADNPMLAPPLADNLFSHHRSPTTPSRTTAR
uniref:Uncharacterized protein n=1 Tax=Fagus sylvatica TaxID=28930 RepID=A0A2N9EJU2_FAGSY